MDEMLKRILDCMGPYHGAGKELADYLGISSNVITNWKNGSSRSYRKYLKQISAKYGVSAHYLETGEKEKTPTQKGERKRIVDEDIMFAFWGGDTKKMSREDLEDVKRYAEFIKKRKEDEGK